MNKSVKRVACLGLSAMTAFSVVGCNKDDKQTNDPETTPLVFSIGALDGNFNPFFATSASDVTIAAQTQIAIVTSDASLSWHLSMRNAILPLTITCSS